MMVRVIKKRNKNAGFSLIELMMVLAVIAVLGGLFFINPGVIRRKEVDKYAEELCSQITLMQTISMARAGQWRLSMYEKDGSYYCVQEKKTSGEGTDGSKSPQVWKAQSGEIVLGSSVFYEGPAKGPVDYLPGAEEAERKNESGQLPLFIWCFKKDTGACMEGAGTYYITGAGKKKQIKVYGQSGLCEAADVTDEPAL